MNEREKGKIRDPKPEIKQQMWEADPMHGVIDFIIEHKDILERTNVEILKNGGGKGNKSSLHLYNISAHDLILKVCGGHCTDDELATLHKNECIVNDFIKEITSEHSNIASNEVKNTINRNMFYRGAPSKISEEVDVKMKGTAAEEYREFNRLILEGELRHKLPYINSSGEKKRTKSWALCDKDYDYTKGDIWFGVTADEAKFFKKHGYFPLRADDQNSKLGKRWTYLAFELANICSGEAHGGCQCPEFCYAKKMETTYKNVRDRVLKFANAWANHTMDEKVDYYYKWITNNKVKYLRNGIRFCDTGDITNQKLLDEVFELVRQLSTKLRAKDIDPVGRFYIYSTRSDLDWSEKPWELVLNASNKALYEKVPDANWFKVVTSWDKIPEEYQDPETLHICNCNCKACDYCAICRNQIIFEVLG